MLWFGATFLLILAAAMAAVILGQMRFARRIAGLEAALLADTAEGAAPTLPPAVATWAARAQAAPSNAVRLTQAAEMRLSRGGKWQPLGARQIIATRAPGFLWEAWQTKGPLTILRVIDSYVAGHGLLEVRLGGAFRVAKAEDAWTDRGEAMRYLAELPWAPDAILCNPALQWQEEGEGAVSVALTLPDGPVRVTFQIDATGDVVAMTAKDRPTAVVDGKPVLREWRGAYRDHGEIGGRRIPRSGEVGYVYEDGGYESYWRGQVTGYAVS